MLIVELIQKRASCPVCGQKVPLIHRMNMSFLRNTWCPHCNTHLTFKKSIFVLGVLLYLLLFPALALTRHHLVLGLFCLLLIVIVSVLSAFTAEFKIDPIIRKRPKV
jgi:hypothetical protein